MTSDEAKEDKDHIKVQVIKNWFEQTFSKHTALKNSLPSEIKREFLSLENSQQNLTVLGLQELPSALTENLKLDLTLGTADDDLGTLELFVSIQVNHVSQELRLVIKGYATNKQISDELRRQTNQELQDLLNYIKQNRKLTTLGEKLPSQIASEQEKVSFAKLGMEDLDSNELLGAQVQILVTHIDDQNGKIGLEVSLSKNGVSIQGQVVVQGYKKNSEVIKEKQEKIAQELEFLAEWISENLNLTSNKTKRPSQVGKNQAIVSLKELGLGNIPDQEMAGALAEFKIVKTDDFEGTIEVKVTVSKSGQTATKTYSISGYKNTVTPWLNYSLGLNKNEIKLVWLNCPAKSLTEKTSVSFEDLGLEKLPPELFKDYDVKIEITSFSDENGSIEVKLTIKKGQITENIQYDVFGYKTTNKVLNELVEIMNRVKRQIEWTTHRDKLPSLIGFKENQSVSLETLGLNKLTELDRKNVAWKLIFISLDDVKGEVRVFVELSYLGVEHKEQITIKGFRTTKDELNSLLEQIRSRDLTTSHQSKLPSQVGNVDQEVSFEDLGLGKLANFGKAENIQVKLSILIVSDKLGTVKVQVILTKNSVSVDGILEIKGFKKEADHIREITDWKEKLNNWFENNWSKTSLKDKLPSQVAQERQTKDFNDLGLRQIPEEYRKIFKLNINIHRVDNLLGQITVNIQLLNPYQEFSVELVIKGFKKESQVKQELEAYFDRIKNRSKTNLEQTLPSDLGILGQTSFKELGLTDLTDEFAREGISVKLLFERADDVEGQVKVKVSLSKDGVEIDKTLTISGFKKVSQELDEVFNYIKERLSKVNFSNTLPSQLGKPGHVISLSKLGLEDFDFAKWASIVVKITIYITNDATGELLIDLRISKNQQTKNAKLTLEGFLTRFKVDQKEIDDMVRQIQGLYEVDNNSKRIDVKVNKDSRFYEMAISEVDVNMIKDNLRTFGIMLPPNLKNLTFEWVIKDKLEKSNTVVLVLKISRGKAQAELIFNITGFKPYSDKLVDAALKKFPDKLRSKWSEKLVSQFTEKKVYKFADLGVEISDFENDALEFSAEIIKHDTHLGEVVATLVISSSVTGYKNKKAITIVGYWNDEKRKTAEDRLTNELAQVFEKAYFDGKLADLTSYESENVTTWASTDLTDQWIDDDDKYKIGSNITWEQLSLLSTTDNLKKTIHKFGQTARLTFELVDRLLGTDFNGLISFKPTLSYIDVQVSSEHPVLIKGFQSFEKYLHSHVRKLKNNLGDEIRQSYSGLLVSLFKEYLPSGEQFSNYPLPNSQNLIAKFFELTQLADKFTYKIDGKYDLFVMAILGKELEKDDPRNYDLDTYEFEFLFGLMGKINMIISTKKFIKAIMTNSTVKKEVLPLGWPVFLLAMMW
ncbi:lipoprotein 17-related variable surface protein [Mycoplasma sp. ATU-Cv-508]|uniref:lipoprotein 17-related variable surface protein n=1 Tax=Mycoplasma sp. ATU-Cv-508 TaxID=2048001 RepID=UPI000FDE7FB5